MKKIFSFLMALIIAFTVISCQCSNTNNVNLNEPAVEQIDSFYVEHAVTLDRETMFLRSGDNYRWFESDIRLVDFLDEENDGSIDMLVNVFQAVHQIDSTSFDTVVYKFQHVGENTVEGTYDGFWVEDYPLNDEQIKVTFRQAYEKVMSVNYPKPHSKYVVLRKQVGPVDANPQWIFGNAKAQLYVDAVTGDVTDENPAFRGLNFGTPLGEWP